MAGRRETAEKSRSKKSETPEAQVNDAVVSDSSESDSFDLSLKSHMHNQSNRPHTQAGSEDDDSAEEGEPIHNGNGKIKSESALYKLPMRRITRIIKSENADMRITHEATFLINKATEKFLELFAKEAYACAFLDRKNQVAYSHLSKVVAKRRRFGFLSDFVPEQVKAEDALAGLSKNEK